MKSRTVATDLQIILSCENNIKVRKNLTTAQSKEKGANVHKSTFFLLRYNNAIRLYSTVMKSIKRTQSHLLWPTVCVLSLQLRTGLPADWRQLRPSRPDHWTIGWNWRRHYRCARYHCHRALSPKYVIERFDQQVFRRAVSHKITKTTINKRWSYNL